MRSHGSLVSASVRRKLCDTEALYRNNVRPCPVEFSGREPAVQLFVTASYEDILESGSYFTNYQDVSC